MEKVTQKDLYGELRVLAEEAGRTDLVEFVDKKIEQLAKKKSSGTLTKTQKENEVIKENILASMVNYEGPVTATEIAKDMDFTVQKISALLNQLAKVEKVVKTTEKGKSLFSIAE